MTDNALMVIDQDRAITAVKVIANIMKSLREDVLKPQLDYGIIPGTGDKPTLLLPGMEKLMRALNAVPEYIERCVIRDYDKPLFHYEYECRLIDCGTGLAVPGGRGVGLCTSMESAFRWRQAERVCPNCGKPAIIKGKAEYGGGWICFAKKHGCGAKFKTGDPAIEAQNVGRIENPDIFDQVNAIMKRAKKRALGDAIKGAANVSEYFTVDLEDFSSFDIDSADVVEAVFTPIDDNKPAAKQPEPPAPAVAPAATKPQQQQQSAAPQYNVAQIVDEISVMYKDPKHAFNSVNKAIKEGRILPTYTSKAAAASQFLYRCEQDYALPAKIVKEILEEVCETPLPDLFMSEWLKQNRSIADAWEAVVEYMDHQDNPLPPAKTKKETPPPQSQTGTVFGKKKGTPPADEPAPREPSELDLALDGEPVADVPF